MTPVKSTAIQKADRQTDTNETGSLRSGRVPLAPWHPVVCSHPLGHIRGHTPKEN